MGREDDHALNLPDNVYDLSISFSIDREIDLLTSAHARGVKLAPRWKEMDARAPLAFGRRTLDVAYHAWIGPHDEEQRSSWAEDWKAGALAAAAGRDALRGLMIFMAPQDTGMCKPEQLAVPLYKLVGEVEPTLPLLERSSRAQDYAVTLQKAHEILNALHHHMKRHGQAVSALSQNPGNPAKREFIAVLAQAWVFLTGKAPGKSPSTEQNPFLRIAEAAWGDLGGPLTSFERAVRTLDRDKLLSEEVIGRHAPF